MKFVVWFPRILVAEIMTTVFLSIQSLSYNELLSVASVSLFPELGMFSGWSYGAYFLHGFQTHNSSTPECVLP